MSLPDSIVRYLEIIRLASQAMFVCFFSSTFSSFLCIFIAPLALYSRVASIPIAFFCLISALMTVLATCVATAMWTILRNTVLSSSADIHIVASIDMKMFIFMWIAAGCALFGALGQMGMMCCGTSRRDIKTGRRVGRKARTEGVSVLEDNPALRRRWWGSVST